MIHNNYRNVGNSCTIYIALLVIAFLIMIVSLLHVFVFIGAFKKKDITRVKFSTNTQTTIY